MLLARGQDGFAGRLRFCFRYCLTAVVAHARDFERSGDASGSVCFTCRKRDKSPVETRMTEDDVVWRFLATPRLYPADRYMASAIDIDRPGVAARRRESSVTSGAASRRAQATNRAS